MLSQSNNIIIDNMTVFHADDDSDDLEFFSDALRRVSTEINLVSYDQGSKLLESLHNPPPTPKMIFLDWNMPVINGPTILRQMMQSQNMKDIPVAILSTSDSQENIEEARKLGAKYFITKPKDFDKWVDAIKYCLTLDWESTCLNDHQFYHCGS